MKIPGASQHIRTPSPLAEAMNAVRKAAGGPRMSSDVAARLTGKRAPFAELATRHSAESLSAKARSFSSAAVKSATQHAKSAVKALSGTLRKAVGATPRHSAKVAPEPVATPSPRPAPGARPMRPGAHTAAQPAPAGRPTRPAPQPSAVHSAAAGAWMRPASPPPAAATRPMAPPPANTGRRPVGGASPAPRRASPEAPRMDRPGRTPETRRPAPAEPQGRVYHDPAEYARARDKWERANQFDYDNPMPRDHVHTPAPEYKPISPVRAQHQAMRTPSENIHPEAKIYHDFRQFSRAYQAWADRNNTSDYDNPPSFEPPPAYVPRKSSPASARPAEREKPLWETIEHRPGAQVHLYLEDWKKDYARWQRDQLEADANYETNDEPPPVYIPPNRR